MNNKNFIRIMCFVLAGLMILSGVATLIMVLMH